MNDIIFNDLVESLKEVEEHVAGKKKLKTTTVTVADLPTYTKNEIRLIREKMRLTQQSFADVIGVSLRTIESWEGGFTSPNGSSRRLLSLLEEDTIANELSSCLIKVGRQSTIKMELKINKNVL